MSEKRVLVACIGNIFHGDDAFGVEVARHMATHNLPDEVQVTDFGIRSYDLAYALLDDCTAVVMVDAIQRGGDPGTLYLIEPHLNGLGLPTDEIINAHSLNPVRVLQMVISLGGRIRSLYLVGCEPATLESPDGEFRLSDPVAAAVPEAVQMIDSLVARISEEEAHNA